MDDLLIRVLTRLLRVHEELGPRAFEQAGHAALVSIARAVYSAAERDAGLRHEDSAKVVHIRGKNLAPYADNPPPDRA